MAAVILWDNAKQRGQLDDPRGYAKIFVDDERGAERLRMHVSVIKPGMRAHDPHQHDGEEIYFILEGEAEVTIKDEAFTAKANTAIFITPNIVHGIRNSGSELLKYMVIIAR